MRRILIENAAVATMDPELGDFARADILVEADTISRVGPDLEVGEVSERIDASQMIAIPGLIDTHRHTWRTALRGLLADRDLGDHLRALSLNIGRRYRPDDMYVGNYLGALDCLNSGITTLVDHCHNVVTAEHAHAAATGLRDAGVRGVFGHGLTPVGEAPWSRDHTRGASGSAAGHPDRARVAGEVRKEHFAASGSLLRFGIAPQELAIAPITEVRREFELARELDARITFHADHLAGAGAREDVRVLHDHDLLGPDLLLVHAASTTEREWGLLAGSGTTVSVCAEAEMQLGMGGFPAIREATEHTPGPALGVDCTSAVGGDLITQARFVLQVARWREHRPAHAAGRVPSGMRWTTRDALRWLTVNGARAAGVDDVVGTLTPGKRADVVLLDMSGISQLGWDRRDPCGAVITQTNSGNVDTVLVDGRMVKQGGRLRHVDTERARGLLAESQDHLEAELALAGGLVPQPPVVIPALDR